MLRLSWIPLVVLVVAPACFAQEKAPVRAGQARFGSTQEEIGVVSPTPEMWFYQQEQSRWEDSRQAVRRKAERKASQRNERMMAQKWYGIDNSRPTVNPAAFFTSYSPFWGSNTYDPNRWRPFASPMVVTRPFDRY